MQSRCPNLLRALHANEGVASNGQYDCRSQNGPSRRPLERLPASYPQAGAILRDFFGQICAAPSLPLNSRDIADFASMEVLDTCHRRRNAAEYEGIVDLPASLTDELVSLTSELIDAALGLRHLLPRENAG
jgi:hypothetical protein